MVESIGKLREWANQHKGWSLYDIQINEIADEIEREIADLEAYITATLGSEQPCFATETNYKRCKYSTNRGWCDDAPMLVWDDTGHLFVTLGGLKTWDVTDDAKKWFAELGSEREKALEELVRDMWFWGYEGHMGSESQDWQMKHIDGVLDSMKALGIEVVDE